MLTTGRRSSHTWRGQRGLSLVELMVGIAVGMFVVAAASMLVANQLAENRRLLLETQLQQDLRAAADIITRDIRRAGAAGINALGSSALISSGGGAAARNGLAGMTLGASQIDFQAQRMTGAPGPYGYRLNSGAIETLLAEAGWQQLTDRAVIRVTTFTVAALDENPVVVPCPKLCAGVAGGTQDCWPSVTVRSVIVDITGQAVSDDAVVRSVRSVSRLQNNVVNFNDPLNPTSACPT